MSEFSLSAINERILESSKFVKPLRENLEKAVVGQEELLNKIIICMLADGHMLLEGVPGLAKTLTVKTLASSLNSNFQRIQFTPDMLPADLIGTLIYNQKSGEFDTRKGPIFSNVILADEINRSPAKVQSALLESMQEKQVTIGENTYKMELPFLVLATQNPLEQEGTYPLPEAQLDRFMFNVVIDYPPYEDEINIVKNNTSMASHTLSKIIDSKNLLEYQKLVLNIPVSDNLIEYAVKLVHNTRPNHESSPDITKKYINWGAGPRASTYLILAAKAKAVLSNKPTPDIDDIISVVKPVLRHRIIPNFNAEAEGIKRDDILDELLESI